MPYRRQANNRRAWFFLQRIQQAREQGTPTETVERSKEFIDAEVTERIVQGVDNALAAVGQGFDRSKKPPSG